MTKDEIEAYQRKSTDHLGRPLRIDGDAGPLTRWALAFDTLCPARRVLLRSGQAFLGLVEDPPRSNSDPRGVIAGWLKHARAKAGDPWCAAFVSWLLSQVMTKAVRDAGALHLARRFPRVDRPIAGDLFCYPTNELGSGHVGLAQGTGIDTFMTLEGNCDNGVRCVERDLDTPGIEFHRPILDATGTPPELVPGLARAPGGTR